MGRWCVALCSCVSLSCLAGVPPNVSGVAGAAQTVAAAGRSSGGAAWATWVMSYNIHHGSGNDDCVTPVPQSGMPPGPDCGLNLERIAEVIRAQRVDIVGLQEVDRFWGRSGMVDQAAALGTMLGMEVCYGANLDHPPDLHSTAPHQYGTLVLSRYEILACENTLLPRADVQSEQRGLLHARIRAGDVKLQFYNTHLHTVEADRRIQVDAIARQIGVAVPAVVLVGDLNARPTEAYLSPLFAVFSDAWVEAGTGPGFTSPALPARPPASRIDYVLASRLLRAISALAVVTPATAMASDHYPVVAGVELPRLPAADRQHDREPARGW